MTLPGWSRTAIDGKPADVFDPPGGARFALLYLHPVGGESLADNAAWTAELARYRFACCAPFGARSWWADRVCPEFDPVLTAERHLLDNVLPWMRERWGKVTAVAGTSMGGQWALRRGSTTGRTPRPRCRSRRWPWCARSGGASSRTSRTPRASAVWTSMKRGAGWAGTTTLPGPCWRCGSWPGSGTGTFTKEDADNSKPSKSHDYVTGKMLNADRPKDWTTPVDYRNGTVHIRAEVLEKPAGGAPTTWSLCYIPNKGRKVGYGCTGTDVYKEKGVYEKDVTMTSFWQNDLIVWEEGIEEMHLPIRVQYPVALLLCSRRFPLP